MCGLCLISSDGFIRMSLQVKTDMNYYNRNLYLGNDQTLLNYLMIKFKIDDASSSVTPWAGRYLELSYRVLIKIPHSDDCIAFILSLDIVFDNRGMISLVEKKIYIYI